MMIVCGPLSSFSVQYLKYIKINSSLIITLLYNQHAHVTIEIKAPST